MGTLVVAGFDISAFEVCRACNELRGLAVEIDGERRLRQRCACEESDESEPRWEGFDFDRVAELCHCCVAEVVPSGSRWSQFFCCECREPVDRFNTDMGSRVVPIGRHSIMNGVMLRASEATPADVGRFVARAGGLFERIECIRGWSRHAVAATLESMPRVDGATTVPLATYLDAARRVGSKNDRFPQMLDSW